MRIRFKSWAREELEQALFYIDNPQEYKNKWKNVFKNDKPEYDTNKQVTKEQTTSLEITPEKMEIDVGENQFIETNLKDVTFKSDDHNIATVSDSGRVKGIKNGTTTITVTAGNQKKTCQVTVKSSQAVITAINASSTLITSD